MLPRALCGPLKLRAAKTELQSQVKRLRIRRLGALDGLGGLGAYFGFGAYPVATKSIAALQLRPIAAATLGAGASNAACAGAAMILPVRSVCAAVNELSEFVVMVVGEGAPRGGTRVLSEQTSVGSGSFRAEGTASASARATG